MSELPFHRERAGASVATPIAWRDLQAFEDILDARSLAQAQARQQLGRAIPLAKRDDEHPDDGRPE